MATPSAVSPQLIVTDGGMRLVIMHNAAAGVGIFGIDVGAGSAYELPGEYGLAHFVEHTIFKGTAHRSSWNIINRMETVGGELNAFTTKEETVVYSIFPSGNENRAIELIADLAINSQFPHRELEKEREVVIDEINSYLDTPSEAIYDDFEEIALDGTPLAHNILGTAESVHALSGDNCRSFVRRNYTKDNIVVFYSGSAAPAKVARAVDKFFATMPLSASRKAYNGAEGAVFAPFTKEEKLDIHQSHVLLGAHVDGATSPHRFAIALFSNIIGGPGMNSLLNIELRERAGLVYNVEASTAMFASTGIINVYFGCDAQDVARCLRRCKATIDKIAQGYITPRRLDAAKKQYAGQLAVAAENRENRIMAAARATLLNGAPLSTDQTTERIYAVSADDIRRLAQAMAHHSTLIYTPRL